MDNAAAFLLWSGIMNLKTNPTKEQLRQLVASQNDKEGAHMLWVSKSGDVFIDTVPPDMTPAGYSGTLDGKLQFRLETMLAGNGYVGPNAAKDEGWIDRLYTALVENHEHGITGYIDSF